MGHAPGGEAGVGNAGAGTAAVDQHQAGLGKSTATPPPRPPPPGAVQGGTPRSASPAQPSKSAFDDLNDSIRMALGGSPSRPAPLAQQQQGQQQQQQQQMQQQQMQQQGFAMFDMGQQPMMPQGGPMIGYGVAPSQAQVPMGFGSPAKQPMSGDGTIRFTRRESCFYIFTKDLLFYILLHLVLLIRRSFIFTFRFSDGVSHLRRDPDFIV